MLRRLWLTLTYPWCQRDALFTWKRPSRLPSPSRGPRSEKWDWQPGSIQQKPDKDNLNKMVMDGMTGIVYADDCQVASGQQHKGWVDRIEWPAHTIVDVYW